MIDFDAAMELVRQRSPKLVAIDGLPVSGKSTLADRLEAELGAQTVYLDDFVRPEAAWRGQASPAFPFPYIRYDEFLSAVVDLGAGRPAQYRRFDWSTGQLADQMHQVEPAGLVVVEGVSSLHPALAPLYDLRLWVESDARTTLAAALARGAAGWEAEWENLFMPSVGLYLETDPAARADHRVRGRGA